MRVQFFLALVFTTVFFNSSAFADAGRRGGALNADSLDKVTSQEQTVDKTADTSVDKKSE